MKVLKKLIIPLLITSILVVIGGCGTKKDSDSLDISDKVAFGKDDYKEIISSNNELGFKLLEGVPADENNNIFISPTSLLMALSMIYNGAEGLTKEEIAEAMQTKDINVNELNKANASLMSRLHSDSDKISLDIANSIWLNKNYHFEDKFAQHTKDYFDAEIQEIDITNSNSSKLINDWVKKATNEKIEEIVEAPLDPNLVAMLINAIYFKGTWKYEFDRAKTEKGTFTLADETKKDVSFMTLSKKLSYLENEKFQAVILPYSDGEMSMSVFLPKENVGLEALEKTLSNKNWKDWHMEFQKKEGTVTLPKFQLEYEVLLNESLKSLGMKKAFEKDADFTKMIKEEDPLWINDVKQKTFIEVNEAGTEAAAVTSIDVKTTSASIDEPFFMEVNRPFFLAITDDETGAILFMGSISNPQ